MAKTIIRVPRTTAMFVTGLGRILREHFGLSITEHEHWTFEHVAQWLKCGSPGECSVHGMSDKFRAQLIKQEGPGPWFDYDHSYVPCHYHLAAYIGTGQVEVRHQKVDLRVRIEQSRVDYLPPDECVFVVHIWIRDAAGNITKGAFGLLDDGRPYVADDEVVPDQPPRRLAFWRQAEEAMPVPA